MCPQYGQLELFVRAGYVQARLLKKSSSFLMILLIEEILHQLRLVVFSHDLQGFSTIQPVVGRMGFLSHQQYPKIHQLGGSWGSLQVAHVRVDHLFQFCKDRLGPKMRGKVTPWVLGAKKSYALLSLLIFHWSTPASSLVRKPQIRKISKTTTRRIGVFTFHLNIIQPKWNNKKH